jgi:pimeloyl-ACP methyl ester carboxylesterase
MRLLILLVAAIAVSCDGVSVTPFPLSACHVDGLAEELRCGVREVFEDRERGSGTRVPIHVTVMPALRRLVAPDPLVLFAGGPGQGARSMAPVAARFFRAIRRHRDIVLIDLRGTGASGPLTCDTGDDEIAALGETDFASHARNCAATLEADPRFYTHRQSLADLDEIRQALGYDRVNLWGGSWGTRAALLYALRYPAAVRTVTLDGAVALTMGFPRTASTEAQAALDALIESCRNDQACHSAFPDPRADIAAFDRRFKDGAITATVRHPRTNDPVTMAISKGLAFDILRGALYVPRDAAAVFQVIRAGAAGNFAPLAAQFVRTSSVTTDDMTVGATFSVLCSEDLPRVMHADFAREAKGSLFGTAYADIWRARCEAWPTGAGIEEADTAIAQAPALILSGGHDPVTPPRAGDAMTRHFTNHRHVIVPAAAHNTSFSGCVPDLIAEFLERGQSDQLDTSCVDRLAWPPFVVGTAGTRP